MHMPTFPFVPPLSVINVQILILYSWKTSIAEVSPTRSHGNSYIFYKVANSYKFIRPRSYKFMFFFLLNHKYFSSFTIGMNSYEWSTPNPAPKPTRHWGLDKLYKISHLVKYIQISHEIALVSCIVGLNRLAYNLPFKSRKVCTLPCRLETGLFWLGPLSPPSNHSKHPCNTQSTLANTKQQPKNTLASWL